MPLWAIFHAHCILCCFVASLLKRFHVKLNMSGGDIANVALSPEGCEFVSWRCRCWRGPKNSAKMPRCEGWLFHFGAVLKHIQIASNSTDSALFETFKDTWLFMVPMAILSDLYTEISFLFGFRVRYKAGAWSLSNISSSGWPLLKHSGHVTTLSEHQRGGIVLPRWPAPLSPSRLDICSLRSKKRFGRLQVSRPFLLSLEMGILGGFGILLVQIKVVDVALGNIYGQPGESGEKMALVGENGCPNTVETSSPGAVLGTAASVLAKTVSESWIRIGDMAGKFARF